MEPSTSSKRKWMWPLAALIALFVGGFIGFFIGRSSPEHFIPVDEWTIEQSSNIAYEFFKDADRQNLAKQGFSGDFPVSYFDQVTQHDPKDSMGIALWFCLDSINNEFFLALEPNVKKYNSLKMPDLPSTDLIRPETVLSFTSQVGTPQELIDFFWTDYRKPSGEKPIANGDAASLIKAFHGKWGKTAKYNFSFFADNVKGDLKDCINRAKPDGYLRYYLGYEDSINGKKITQKLRVILMAVDKNGKPQFKTTTDSSRDGMLQASWPPPPFN